MDKKYQVFISSTYIDLIEERQAVVEAILKVGHIPAGMELFKSGRSQLETIKKWIDNSDIYLLILGGRYGSIDKETGKSYTQLEYEYAINKGMPVFAIVIKDELTRQKVKVAEKHEDIIEIYNKNKYDDFKKTVLSKIVAFAGSLSEIKLAIHENIHQFKKDYKLKGWIRGGSLKENEIATLTIENKKLKNKLERDYKLKGNEVIRESSEVVYNKKVEEVKINNNKIFIVHGHDEALKSQVARVIEKLKLEPIILHEQVSSGKTIIEKLEEYTNVGYGIVLYTPCDIGGGKSGNLNGRARQNVVLEHGYLTAKLGRNRVMAIKKGGVELPGDMSGIIYTSAESEWKFSLVGELKKLGYDVDANDLY